MGATPKRAGKAGLQRSQGARDRRLAAPRGSFQAQGWLAAEEAETLEVEARKSAMPDLALLYGHTTNALAQAVGLAAQSRATPPADTITFVGHCTRLVEHFKRVEKLAARPELWELWPRAPGTTFSWKGGDSALGVAYQFARMIHGAVEYGRLEALGVPSKSLDPLPVCPEPDERFAAWRDATIREMQEHTLPPLPAWPIWEIHRDRQALYSKLEDEWDNAQRLLDSLNQPKARGRRRQCPEFDDAVAKAMDAERYKSAAEMVERCNELKPFLNTEPKPLKAVREAQKRIRAAQSRRKHLAKQAKIRAHNP